MNEDYFEFWLTDAEGNQRSIPRRVRYSEKHILLLMWKWEVKQFMHFLALAASAPNHPVDVTKFDEKTGGLIFSARLYYRPRATSVSI